VKANQADHTVSMMCRVLGISRSGYYAWRDREPSARAKKDVQLQSKIRRFHVESRGTYGAPRIHVDLIEDDEHIGRKRVARLMKAAGLRGVCRRKRIWTTVRDGQRPAPDLVDRNFSATGPNQLWVADITYVPTWAGVLYLAVVLDVWSRRIVGWCMRPHLKTELILEALNMAVDQRRPVKVIHHSDQGCQYTSLAFGTRCKQLGVLPSMGSVGDCYDNAMCESFFATLECELLDLTTFRTQTEARSEIFEFIEAWYNRRRRHSALGYQSPLHFELAAGMTCGETCGKAGDILLKISPQTQTTTASTIINHV
jgi:putative transposase